MSDENTTETTDSNDTAPADHTDENPPAEDRTDASKSEHTSDYLAKLKAEAASRRVEAKELRAKLDQRDAEFAAMKEQLHAAETVAAERDAAQREIAQVRAATAAGLPLDIAPRLQGETPEELVEDAKAMRAMIGGPDLGQSSAPSTSSATSRNSLVRGT